MGEVRVPADRYWGAQTERSRINFPIGAGKEPMPEEIILAFEKDTPDGERDYREVRENIEGYVQGGSIETPITLEP